MMLRLKELREARGLTQVELAKLAGVSRSHLSEFETGTKRPNTARLEKLADALGVEAWEILRPKDEADRIARITRALEGLSEEDLDAIERHARSLQLAGRIPDEA